MTLRNRTAVNQIRIKKRNNQRYLVWSANTGVEMFSKHVNRVQQTSVRLILHLDSSVSYALYLTLLLKNFFPVLQEMAFFVLRLISFHWLFPCDRPSNYLLCGLAFQCQIFFIKKVKPLDTKEANPPLYPVNYTKCVYVYIYIKIGFYQVNW